MKRLIHAVLIFCLVFTPFTILAQSPVSARDHHEYRIVVHSNYGGTVNPEGRITVSGGESAHIRIHPNNGYVIKRVIVDGEDVGPVHNYKFRNIHESHRVYVEFERKHHRGGGYFGLGYDRDEGGHQQDNDHRW